MALDFTQTNELIKRMLQFRLQDRLGEKRSERSIENFREQIASYERRGKLLHEMRLELQGKDNTAKTEYAILSASLRAAQDPTADEDKVQAQILEVAGRPDEAATRRKRSEERLARLSEVEAKRFMDEDSPATEEILVLMREAGIKEAGDILEKGAARRVTKETQELTRSGQALEGGRLEVSRDAQALARDKFTAEQAGLGKESKEEYRDYIGTLVDDANSFLTKVLTNPGDYVEADEEGNILDQTAKEAFAGAGAKTVSKKDLRFLITRNNRLANKARTGKITDKELNQLLTIQNIEESLLELTGRPGGEVGDILPRTGAELPVETAPTEVAPQLPAGNLTPEQSINVLAGMLMEKAKAAGGQMQLDEAMAAARRILGIK